MKPCDDLLAYLRQRPNRPLYHYTSPQGILGIFSSKTIWASSVFHLNDVREYRYAAEVIQETLRNALKAQNGPMNRSYGELLENFEGLARNPGLQVFVASFSEEGDLLSQWLAYGAGTNAYSLGLRRAHFREAFRQGFTLLKCIYEENEHVDLAWSIIKALAGRGTGESPGIDVVVPALLASAAMKHVGFKQEAEWRLVRMGGTGWMADKNIHYRPGRNGIVPYLEVPLLKQRNQFRPDVITLGPNDDMDAAELAMETFLGSQDMRHFFSNRGPKVIRSRTPYRP